MKFNIVNPSDPYTMEADDLEIAAVAVCLLGDGKYPLDALGDDADKGNNVPAFLFGGHDEWFTSRFGRNYEATADLCITQRGDALARALESVTLQAIRRTSMNDIGERALRFAQNIRALAAGLADEIRAQGEQR